ncbi:hypothetical protein CMEL01_08124 [Colletotrichum melonis]|uniref:Uncharacterized protein n=2 Tax=Colletotrichum acutatum species complex TaxID=2707335 RepID=A0AAI9U1I1_9PEZI|nr:hypothetical protein CLIM01_12735 [Colletotrichum limetticola]KAK1448809.1 hypothetical protein CMEL01_08124 [Colletotrichum melonis]
MPTPPARPRARPRTGDEIITVLYTSPKARPPCGGFENNQEFITLGYRGYQSSTRVGSVAPLGNQE